MAIFTCGISDNDIRMFSFFLGPDGGFIDLFFCLFLGSDGRSTACFLFLGLEDEYLNISCFLDHRILSIFCGFLGS